MKRLKVVAITALFFCSFVTASACSVTNVSAVNTMLSTGSMHSVNNEDSFIDFKLNDSDFDIVNKIVENHTELSGVDKNETETMRNSRMERDLSRSFGSLQDEYQKAAITWLINNNVYSRPHNVRYSQGYPRSELLPVVSQDTSSDQESGGGTASEDGDTEAKTNESVDKNAWLSVNAYAKKADFYMMLYKATNGVKCSNVCLYKGSAYRPTGVGGITADNNSPVTSSSTYSDRTAVGSVANYWGEYLSADFTSEYYAFVTPDVYELYFKELVDSGVLSLEDFSETSAKGSGFVKDYKDFANAEWNTTNEAFSLAKGSKALGYSFSMSNNSIVRSTSPNYFKENKITVIDALSTIADYLRLTEKEISKTEAKVIAYKYGLMYFSELDEEIRDTMYFLIAKGILSFDDPDRMINTSGYLTRGQMYELMYRVANKDARYDFSKIQLTDSDSELADLGFAETKCDIVDAYIKPIRELVSVKVDNGGESTEVSNIELDDNFFSKARHVLSLIVAKCGGELVKDVTAASSNKDLDEYVVTMQFDTSTVTSDGKSKPTGNKYVYKANDTTIEINENLAVDENKGITAVEKSVVESGSAKINVVIVTFKVSAASKSEAVRQIDKNIKVTINKRAVSTVTGISRIEDTASNSISTLMEQDSIVNLFSDITFLSDKVLINNKTGVKAIIAPEKGMALVGSNVIKSNNIMIITNKAATKKYYNVELLTGLISSLSLSNAGFNSNSNNTLYNITTYKESSVNKITYDNGVSLETKAYYVNVGKTTGAIREPGKDNTAMMYNTNSLCDGISTLTRTFEVTDPSTKGHNKETTKITLIVDFQFIVPPVELVSRSEDWFKISGVSSNKNLTLQDVIDFETVRPADGTIMADYWDSNIAFSNAIANFMYGTKKEEWITCGYIVPQIHVCIEGLSGDDCKLNKEFGKNIAESKAEQYLNALFFDTEDVERYTYLSKYSKYLRNESVVSWWKSYLTATGISCSSEDQAALTAFLSKTRIFKVYPQYKTNKSGVVFSKGKKTPAFFITDNGIVYRTAGQDDRIVACTNNNKITSIIIKAKSKLNDGANTVVDKTKPKDVDKEVVFKTSNGKTLKFWYSTKSDNSNIILVPAMSYNDYLDDQSVNVGFVSSLALQCGASKIDAGKSDESAYAYVDMSMNSSVLDDLKKTYSKFQERILGVTSNIPGSTSFTDLLSVDLRAAKSFWGPISGTDSGKQLLIDAGIIELPGMSGAGSKQTATVITKCDNYNVSSGYTIGSAYLTDGLCTIERDGSLSSVDLLNDFHYTNDHTSFYALATPVFYLSTADYEFVDNALIKKSEINVIFDNLQVFTPSLNDYVINATMDNDLGTVSIGDLDTGTKLVIEDSVWTKQANGRWVSDPIKNKKLIARCKTNKPSKIKKALGLYFQSCLLSYNGSSYPLLNYVNQKDGSSDPAARLGVCTECDSKTVYSKGVLCASSDGTPIIEKYNKKKKTLVTHSTDKSISAEYVILDVNLDASLKAMPFNASRTMYNLCTNVGEGIVGSAAYTLFDEDLNYDLKDDFDVSVAENGFSPSRFATEIRDSFNEEHSELVFTDTIRFCFYLVFMLACYLMVMSWVAFMVLNRGVGLVFFEKVEQALSINGKGLDLFKIFTFGMYSITDPPNAVRSVIITFVCCVVAAICLFIL